MNQNPKVIQVDLVNNPYNVIIGGKGLKNIGEELIRLGINKNTKILLVTNPIIYKYYGEQAINQLKGTGLHANSLTIEEGETNKNLSTIEKIHNAAFDYKLERGSLIIALGGGVVGDIAGFAAATWLRGISFIQVPTTLLAMVDASIGGKTGVNHPGGKNLIGAFHQPKLVLIDPLTLDTLPQREFRAGMAEVIKYAVIGDYELFKLLEDSPEINSLSGMGKDLIEEILQRSASTKAKIVMSDEREGGLRAILNYGHTFGHVIENLCGYGKYLHGEAVAIGMVAAGQLAVLKGKWQETDARRQKDLIKRSGLPTVWPSLDINKVLKTLEGDKKVRDGKVRFILPTSIGSTEISNDIDKTEIVECLKKIS
ncbi:3-dehydroquinate synthase [Prochlorococcus sp. MIT 1223]|uniref:3-dehydroquinate synthase n=1 Tax=Prochlorococcus sp. MIT 1223 TaxID=3096217 RepID=UPI002A762C13|nr:3-dehydroquinate synthase [Prochlorococcus sp. MIT 1223]